MLDAKGQHDFLAWLSNYHEFSHPRTIGDQLSRLKRVSRQIDVDENIEDPILLARLETCVEFASSSYAVKSQMRKALRLYRAYLRSSAVTSKV